MPAGARQVVRILATDVERGVVAAVDSASCGGAISHVDVGGSARRGSCCFAGPARRMVVSGLGRTGISPRRTGRDSRRGNLLEVAGGSRRMVRWEHVAVCRLSFLEAGQQPRCVCRALRFVALARRSRGLSHRRMAPAERRAALVGARLDFFAHGRAGRNRGGAIHGRGPVPSAGRPRGNHAPSPRR